MTAKLYPAFKVWNAVKVGGKFGVRPERVLEGTGLREADCKSPDTRVSLTQVARTFVNLGAKDKHLHRAIELGANLLPTDYGVYGLAVATGARAADGFEAVFAYSELEVPTVLMILRLAHDESEAHFIFQDNLQIPDIYEFNMISHAALCISFMRHAISGETRAKRAEFSMEKPKESALLERHMECPCIFNAPETKFVFPESWLERPTKMRNPLVRETMLRACETAVSNLRKDDTVAAAVSRCLRSDLAGYTSFPKLATDLARSESTLRRQLASEGTSFQALLQQARLRRSVHLLKNRALSTEDVAHELGYSTVQNFRTAFKSWTGITVNEYQQLAPESTVELIENQTHLAK